MFRRAVVLFVALLAGCAALPVATPNGGGVNVEQARVLAHETYLAGDALRGRGSATADEAAAADYVAAQYRAAGLIPAPGVGGYIQTFGLTELPPSAPGRRPRWQVGAPQPGQRTTVNAIGYLPETDPSAGVIMISAHLDHLGVGPDGKIYHGANDDASGVTAVLELARTLAARGPHKRGLLFVCYGSEEMGLLGSRGFGENPPISLTDLVANLEIEMIGAQDSQLPSGVMMMTGFDRSDFGAAMKARGALIAPDPYPDQHFFERSDNYSLALQGVVAHTISGWATTPTYHTADDDLAHLDIPFMTRAIQSLVEPLAWLADSDYRPAWREGGRPTRDR